MRVWAALLPVAVALAACSAAPTKITAAPGMTADDFNRANAAAGTRLRIDQTDWIGINAPVDLTINWNGKTVTFEDRQRGGGVQISSHSEDYRAGKPVGPLRIASLNFSVGGDMQRLEEVWPTLQNHCKALAQMAGVADVPLPAPRDISDKFRQAIGENPSGFGPSADEGICGGSSEEFSFAISAHHSPGHRKHGGDYEFAFIRGFVSKPVIWDGEPLP